MAPGLSPHQLSSSPERSGPNKARLTEEEKQKNHITSEQKRRKTIRKQFDKLCRAVPTLKADQGRSEGVVLNETTRALLDEIEQRRKLVAQAEALGIAVEPELMAPLNIDLSEVDTSNLGPRPDYKKPFADPDLYVDPDPDPDADGS